jgi:hypothetical protein
VADHSLKPATDHRLGEPLPHQLANQTQAHQKANRSSFNDCSSYKGLPIVSKGYTFPFGRFLRVTHPSATHRIIADLSVRLACVKHTASVHPEPGSNSQKKHKCFSVLLNLSSILLLHISQIQYCPPLTQKMNQARNLSFFPMPR